MTRSVTLTALDGASSGKTLPVVPVSADGADLAAVLAMRPEAVLLADCRGVEDLQAFDIALSVAEARADIAVGSTGIVAGAADSAAGLLKLATLGGKSVRLKGLAWDREAFCGDMGCAADSEVARQARTELLVAARAFGVPAYEAE